MNDSSSAGSSSSVGSSSTGCVNHKKILSFPVTERRPIIAMAYLPRPPALSGGGNSAFDFGGLLVLTLGSMWFFECVNAEEDEYEATRLPLEGRFWAMRVEARTRAVIVTVAPNPHARHVVCQLSKVGSVNDSRMMAL